MVKILSFCMVLLSFHINAAEIIGKISQIDYPQNQSEMPLLFMDDGSVLKITSRQKSDLLPYINAERNSSVLRISINKKRQVLGVETLGYRPTVIQKINEVEEYLPTVLNSETEAYRIFSNLRRARSRSQCYNRAHIWTYESKKKFNLDSMKVFMFYTRRYIREYDFDWWFHVAPFTYVGPALESSERVLDFTFTRSPVPMKTWTDIFMRNDAYCPTIKKYSEYENNQEGAYCYLYKTHMYDYQPLDLEARERSGAMKTNWVNWEVNNAYRNGFGYW